MTWRNSFALRIRSGNGRCLGSGGRNISPSGSLNASIPRARLRARNTCNRAGLSCILHAWSNSCRMFASSPYLCSRGVHRVSDEHVGAYSDCNFFVALPVKGEAVFFGFVQFGDADLDRRRAKLVKWACAPPLRCSSRIAPYVGRRCHFSPSNEILPSRLRACCAVRTWCFHFFPKLRPSITRSMLSSHISGCICWISG